MADLHRIGAAGLPALRARLHSLRRLDFPNGVSGSSGRHFAYAAADLIGVLAAMELIEAYLPPTAAVAIVREGWPEIASCTLAGRGASPDASLAVVHPNALVQALTHAAERTSDTLHVEIAALAPAPAGRTIDIPVGAMASAAAEALQRIDPRSAELFRLQMDELGERFGNGPALPRPDGPDGRLGSDGPYWTRAQSFLRAVRDGGHADGDRRRLIWQLGYLGRPAPVDAWKTRVEVRPDLDIGFGVAITTVAAGAGLRNARVDLPHRQADEASRHLGDTLGDRNAIADRLIEIARAGELLVRAGPDGAGANAPARRRSHTPGRDLNPRDR